MVSYYPCDWNFYVEYNINSYFTIISNKTMSQYRYLKLRNGEDIVAMTVVNDTNGTVELTLPCNIALSQSLIGKGAVIKLSPLVPFTKDNRVIVAANEVVYTTTIDDKFIQFYDKACKDWIHLRDEIGLNVMSPKQELTTGQDMLEKFASEMKDRMLTPEEELFLEEEMDLDMITQEDKKILH